MMATEVLDLLEYIQLGDGRTIGKADVEQWLNILPKHIVLVDAMKAVEIHRRESAAWLMPSHIIEGVKRVNLERRREEARLHAADPARMAAPNPVPWWFRKLYEAELEETRRGRRENPEYRRKVLNGDYPVEPKYEGDSLTLAQKLAKYGIVQEEGDSARSAVFAVSRIPSLPVPKLGSFIRDPEANTEPEPEA